MYFATDVGVHARQDKFENMMRLVIVPQILWCVNKFFARLVHRLIIAVGEFSTVPSIFAGVSLILLWGHKTADVEISTTSTIEAIMRNVLSIADAVV